MKMTKRIAAIAACAIMTSSAIVGNFSAVSNNYVGTIANASIIDGSPLTESTSADNKIVHITTYHNGSASYSTGFIVDDHTIATCAHSLYKNGAYADSVEVRIGRYRSSTDGKLYYKKSLTLKVI